MFKFILLFSLLSLVAYSHGGGTNSEGCHNNRKTGGYHCHNSGQGTFRKVKTMKYDAVKFKDNICCKVCRKGKACGDSCISRDKVCQKPKGCACDV